MDMKLETNGKGAARLSTPIGEIILTPGDIAEIRYFLGGLMDALRPPTSDDVDNGERTDNVMSPLDGLGGSKIRPKLRKLIGQWLHDWADLQADILDRLSLPDLKKALKGTPYTCPDFVNDVAAEFQSDADRAAFYRLVLLGWPTDEAAARVSKSLPA